MTFPPLFSVPFTSLFGFIAFLTGFKHHFKPVSLVCQSSFS